MKEFHKLNQLTETHGALRPGKRLITGMIALSLAILMVNDFADDTNRILLIVLVADLVRNLFRRACVTVTPDFHHRHHAQGFDAIDKNCAAHFAFLDHRYGTAVQSNRAWPDRCGGVGNGVPNGFFRQLAIPFWWKG